MTKVVSWDELNFDTEGATLLLGNGASIAVSDRFNYKSLYEQAKKHELLCTDAQAVFDEFKQTNFESVMRVLAEAERVSTALGQRFDTRDHVNAIRNALIQVVRLVHPKPGDVNGSSDDRTVEQCLQPAAEFAGRFETIVTFNYDLLLYWMLMQENHLFGDCFYRPADSEHLVFNGGQISRKSTVFYAHGALFLAREAATGLEFKVVPSGSQKLIECVINSLEKKGRDTLYVSEGDDDSKLKAIRSSPYLSHVHYNVLGKMSDGVVAYGLSFSDKYLAKLLGDHPPKHLAVAVQGKDDDERGSRAAELQGCLSRNSQIDFFDAESPGCWIHPPKAASL